MSDAGSDVKPSLLGGTAEGMPEEPDFLSGIINPDWMNGPVLTDDQVAAALASPQAAALGIDLTQPIPQMPGGGPIPIIGSGGHYSDAVWHPGADGTDGGIVLISDVTKTTPSPQGVAPEPGVSSNGDEVGQYYLPGVGQTYFNPDFADKVGSFISNMQSHGITPDFVSGYRDRDKQAGLSNPNRAENSLHSAGRAVDVAGWKTMDPAKQAQIISDAKAAGLSWGGSFSDFNHFYSDPGEDRNKLIDDFTQGINTLKNQIPDD